MIADQYTKYCNLSFDKEANIIAIADIFTYNYQILNMLILDEVIKIALFKIKMLGNMLRNSHKNCSNIICSLLTICPSSMETIYHLLQKLIGITYIFYDICKNGCYCYAKSPSL